MALSTPEHKGAFPAIRRADAREFPAMARVFESTSVGDSGAIRDGWRLLALLLIAMPSRGRFIRR
jgi:hypothetical protein